MKFFWLCCLFLAFLSRNELAHAQEKPTERPSKMYSLQEDSSPAYPFKAYSPQAYSSQVFFDDISAIKWEAATIFVATTSLGFANWEWGTQKKWASNSEGWFSKHTRYGGADKLGHAYTSYVITNVLTERLIMQGRPTEQAALTSALFSSGLQLYVEVFDGFSKKYGSSWEDATINLLGSAFAYARHATPGMRDLIDFRIEYEKSDHNSFDPLGDYSGQKYLLALKLSGTNTFRNTPLRYLELQTGYYAKNFNHSEQADGTSPSRHIFFGIGINASELFFGPRRPDDSGLRRLGRGFFEHVQIPRTAVRSNSSY